MCLQEQGFPSSSRPSTSIPTPQTATAALRPLTPPPTPLVGWPCALSDVAVWLKVTFKRLQLNLCISFKCITDIYWLLCVLATCPQCDASFSASASLPATIVTSSVPTSVAGHMMYPSPHTVMYASTPALADGGLAVLNAFSQATPTMQVSHAQAQDTGALFLCIYTHFWVCQRAAILLSFFLNRCCPSGVPHSTSRNGPDPSLSGAATPSTARSAFYKWNSHILYAISMTSDSTDAS